MEQLGQALIESNGKMQEMVVSMNEINDASHEIDKIIATINEIASQTNLLAFLLPSLDSIPNFLHCCYDFHVISSFQYSKFYCKATKT